MTETSLSGRRNAPTPIADHPSSRPNAPAGGLDKQKNDMINSPPHYIGAGGIEAIDVIEQYGLCYHLGNAAKYIIRAGLKGSERDDLAKARWYCRRWLTSMTFSEPEDNATDIAGILTAFGLSGHRAMALSCILSAGGQWSADGSISKVRGAIEKLTGAIIEIDEIYDAGDVR